MTRTEEWEMIPEDSRQARVRRIGRKQKQKEELAVLFAGVLTLLAFLAI